MRIKLRGKQVRMGCGRIRYVTGGSCGFAIKRRKGCEVSAWYMYVGVRVFHNGKKVNEGFGTGHHALFMMMMNIRKHSHV